MIFQILDTVHSNLVGDSDPWIANFQSVMHQRQKFLPPMKLTVTIQQGADVVRTTLAPANNCFSPVNLEVRSQSILPKLRSEENQPA